MQITSQIKIAAPLETVWALISDPDLIAQWNTKLVATEPLGPKEPALNRTYRFTFRMSKRDQVSDAEITQFEYPTELTWTYQGISKERAWTVIDRFILKEVAGSIHLRRSLDLTKTPIPLLIKPIVWAIMKSGRPTGLTELQQLKRIAETV